MYLFSLESAYKHVQQKERHLSVPDAVLSRNNRAHTLLYLSLEHYNREDGLIEECVGMDRQPHFTRNDRDAISTQLSICDLMSMYARPAFSKTWEAGQSDVCKNMM